MRFAISHTLLGVCLLVQLGFSAPPAAPTARYERIICVVPLVGTGTYHDPRRPMFTPPLGSAATALPGGAARSLGFLDPAQVLGYASVLTDDGQHAIVQFVARDRAAFRPMLTADPNLVQVFERGRLPGPALLQQLQKLKKHFTFQSLEVGAQ
jgi:hypothetical protein